MKTYRYPLSRGESLTLKWFSVIVWACAPLVIGAMLALSVGGCSASYWTSAYPPETKVEVSKGLFGVSVRVRNTKDVNVDLGEVAYDPDTGWSIAHLKFTDMASPVLDAQVAVIGAVAEAQRVQVEYVQAIGQGVAMAIAAGGDAVSRFLSVVPSMSGSLDLGSIGSGSVDVAPTPLPVPTSQPVP